MTKSFVFAVLTVLAVTGCSKMGESRMNPFNWFGGSKQEMMTPAEAALIADPRSVVAQVTGFEIEAAPGGAILRATGLPETQGFWDGELVPEAGEQPVNGVLTYTFRIAQPAGFEQVNTPRSREVVVARFVPNARLQGVRTIRVQGAQNMRTSRR